MRARGRNTRGGKTLPFAKDEVSRMLCECAEHPLLHAVVLTFLCTGLRIGDVQGLRKDALREGRLTVRTQKNRRVLSIPVHEELAEAIRTWREAESPVQLASPLLFPTRTGKSLVSLDAMLRRMWRRCSIAAAHAHRFRDTFAVRLLEQGATLYDVAKLLGIDARTAERHYTPYVRELQERGARLVSMLEYR